MKKAGFGLLSVIMLIILGFLFFGTYLYVQNVRQSASASPTPVSRYVK
ncbi:MAG: hypothetical protein UT00_C0029G0006 [Parcubacteria group bacterium GW2011_GWA1_38_7]|nr:MAG: hypothetical protein UT00_C0029G0006 [Parcubacteria group bacterium GW2011_GWA1_38_7]